MLTVRNVSTGRSSMTPISTIGDHDERALGGDLGAGEHQIKRRHDEAPSGRPFLDGMRSASAGINASARATKKNTMPATTAM